MANVKVNLGVPLIANVSSNVSANASASASANVIEKANATGGVGTDTKIHYTVVHPGFMNLYCIFTVIVMFSFYTCSFFLAIP